MWERVLVTAMLIVAAVMAAWFASVAFAAFSYFLAPEEPRDWSTQSLEVVVDGPREKCLLNVGSVSPGRHEVHVIAVGSRSRVVIRAPSGRVLFRAVVEPDRPGGPEVPAVQLGLGTHHVHCRSDAGLSKLTKLQVLPERELE